MGLDLYAARAEDLLGRPERETHVGKVEFAFALCLILLLVALPVVLCHALAQTPVHVLLGCHHHWRGDVAGRCAEGHACGVGRQVWEHLDIGGVFVVFLGLGLGCRAGVLLVGLLVAFVALLRFEHGANAICSVLLVIRHLSLQVCRVAQVRRAMLHIIDSLRSSTPHSITRLLPLDSILGHSTLGSASHQTRSQYDDYSV